MNFNIDYAIRILELTYTCFEVNIYYLLYYTVMEKYPTLQSTYIPEQQY